MPALRMKEDDSGRLTLQSPVLPQIGNLVSMLVWLAVLAFFILPVFGNNEVDWSNLVLIGFFFLITVGGSLVGNLLRTIITIDPGRRVIQSTRRFLSLNVQSAELSFNELTAIESEYYRHASGRTAHDAWRVLATARDGRRLMLNWDGKREEMADLANQISTRTGAPVVDNSERPGQTAQQILDRMQREGQGMPQVESGRPEDLGTPTSLPSSPQDTSTGRPAAQVPEAMGPAFDIPTIPSEADKPDQLENVWDLPMSELERRVAGDSLDSDARYVLGRKFQSSGQLDKAVELYQKAMALDPANGAIQNDLGVALAQRGRKGEAETAFRRAVALDPFSSTAHLNLGLVLRSANRASEASQEFYLARQNARGDAETRAAEAASTGSKLELQLSRV